MDDNFRNKLVELLTQQYNNFAEAVNDLRERLDKRNDDVFTKMDAVYKEVLIMRQEQAAHIGSHTRVDEQLGDHEKRMKKLESKRAVV